MAERYSAEQVQKILVLAMEQTEQEGFSRSQLQEMAADLGISPNALKRAEQAHLKEVSEQVDSIQDSKQQQFRQQLRTYAVVNAFLLALNFTLSGTITWAIYPLLGWGLGLFLPTGLSPCQGKQQVLDR